MNVIIKIVLISACIGIATGIIAVMTEKTNHKKISDVLTAASMAGFIIAGLAVISLIEYGSYEAFKKVTGSDISYTEYLFLPKPRR